MSRRALTLVMPYYENRGMLEVQLDYLGGLPDDVRTAIELIVVDDGSSNHPLDLATLEEMKDCDLREVKLFRILVDVRWNWIAARNLAMNEAQTQWRLMTDIDHVVPEATWRRLQEHKLNPRTAYRFGRVDAPDMTPYKPHPNSWLVTDELFNKAGGYDERFSGFYGSDGEFRDRITAAAVGVEILPQVLIRYPRELVPDASTTAYGRKEPQDLTGVQAARRLIAADPTPRRLSFPWEQIL